MLTSAARAHHAVEFLLGKYGHHPALLRVKDLPVFYVYDSYHLPIDSWKELLLPGGKHSVRGAALDALYVGLYLNRGHERYATEGGFDGLYTYFAATAFSDGTRLAEWPRLNAWARQHSILFVPCVGPGYDDSR
jgi:glycoprotein endo-alpha-1,2-mannosidase